MLLQVTRFGPSSFFLFEHYLGFGGLHCTNVFFGEEHNQTRIQKEYRDVLLYFCYVACYYSFLILEKELSPVVYMVVKLSRYFQVFRVMRDGIMKSPTVERMHVSPVEWDRRGGRWHSLVGMLLFCTCTDEHTTKRSKGFLPLGDPPTL